MTVVPHGIQWQVGISLAVAAGEVDFVAQRLGAGVGRLNGVRCKRNSACFLPTSHTDANNRQICKVGAWSVGFGHHTRWRSEVLLTAAA